MEISQIYQLANSVTSETLGDSAVLSEDLSNVVDIGTAIFNANSVDKYVRSLVDHIGKVIFVNRPYSGNVVSVLRDGWEWGAVLQKISAALPAATENETWELTDGQTYDPNIFYKPTVENKFYNKRVTFEIPMSFTERQVRGSFSSVEQYNAFISMLYNEIEKSMTVKTDGLIMRTIANMIGGTLYDLSDSGDYSTGNTRAINLLKLYNDTYSKTLTTAKALTDPAFIRFAAYIMALTKSRLSRISTLFNVGGQARFTPADSLHFVTLAEFSAAADVFLQSDVYHDEYTRIPDSERVPYWQGSGTGYALGDTSKIDITTADGHAVSASGILGVMFDRDALGVANLDRRVTSNFNPKAEFYSNWYKFDAGYFNDFNENFVVFYMA